MANIQITLDEIKLLEKELNCQIYLNDPLWGLNKLEIVRFENGFLIKSWPLPKKKPVDKKYIAEKLNLLVPNNNYKNLQKVFEKLSIQGAIYYTSFGFSYDCLFKSNKRFDSDIEIIKKQLDTYGVVYTTEFSDAQWVFRFKISKSKANLKLINCL